MFRATNRFLHKKLPVATAETESKEMENGSSSVPSHSLGIDKQSVKEEPAVPGPIMSDHSLQMLKEKVGSFLEDNEMGSLARTSQTMHGLFKKILENRKETLVKKLLQHVVYGEEKEADNLLKKHPNYLQHFLDDADTVTDYAGRRIHGTAYQIALGAEDELMLAMLLRHFSKLDRGFKARQAQRAAQFPAGEEKAWALRQRQDREELRRVVQAIADAPNAAACAGAIQAFHAYMDKPKGDENGVIRTGRHFNARQLFDAFMLYRRFYHQLGGRNSWKNNCLWRQVIGYIQRHLPACYAQAFCHGIWDIVVARESLRRSFNFRHNPNALFFPLDTDPDARLGHDYAVTVCGQGRGELWVFQSFWSEKNTTVLSLMFEVGERQHQRACCVIQ